MDEIVFGPFFGLLVLQPSVVDVEKTEVVAFEVVELNTEFFLFDGIKLGYYILH